MIKKLLFIIISITVFIKCTNYRDITYLRNLKPSSSDSLFKTVLINYRLQADDILYIKVNSIDENINNIFNGTSQAGQTSGSSSSGESGYYISGYTVDADGNVNLPVLGKISVIGQTITEAQNIIQKIAEKYIANVRVNVKLVSFKISILGEVRKPGQYSIFCDRSNIFEALALAGDINYYGNRKSVLILRNKPGETVTYTIDLTDKNIISSSLYYMQPNDVVYVVPLKSTGIKLSASDYSTLISTISITLTTIVLIIKFVNL